MGAPRDRTGREGERQPAPGSARRLGSPESHWGASRRITARLRLAHLLRSRLRLLHRTVTKPSAHLPDRPARCPLITVAPGVPPRTGRSGPGTCGGGRRRWCGRRRPRETAKSARPASDRLRHSTQTRSTSASCARSKRSSCSATRARPKDAVEPRSAPAASGAHAAAGASTSSSTSGGGDAAARGERRHARDGRVEVAEVAAASAAAARGGEGEEALARLAAEGHPPAVAPRPSARARSRGWARCPRAARASPGRRKVQRLMRASRSSRKRPVAHRARRGRGWCRR